MKKLIALLFVSFLCDLAIMPTRADGQTCGTTINSAAIVNHCDITISRNITFNPSTSVTLNQLFIDAVLPAGLVMEYGGTSAPAGFLMCDGAAVSRTTYSRLFTAINTTYGTGDGSTTFNLPDTRQRFPLGLATSGTGSTLGGTGGSVDHLHTVDPPNTASTAPSSTVAATNLTGSAASTTHTHDVDISQFNSGTNNPPFIVFNYIIKY